MNGRRTSRGWLIVLAAFVVVCLCLGCLAAGWFYVMQGGQGGPFSALGSTPTPASSGATLRLVGGKPVTLDPALAEDATSSEYVSKVFVGLVSLDADLQVRPELAESWTVSADGRVYTFSIREDARFQDGRPVTADDVKYSLERSCAPETGSRVAGTYLGDVVGAAARLAGKAADVSGIKVLDERTVQITIDAPKSYFLPKLTYSTAAVVDRRNVEASANWLDQPNGAGPYRLAQQTDEEIVLQANSHYFRGKPAIETVRFLLPAGDPMTMYETGELDAVPVGVEDFERTHDPYNPLHLELMEVPSLNVQYVALNTRLAPFDDVKVRQAFAYATNRKAIIDILLKKSAREALGVLPPGLPGYNENLAGLSYDPEKARQLLRESRYGGAGALPAIVFAVGYGDTEIAEALVAMYREALGANVEIQQVEWGYFLRDLSEGRYALFSLGWSADYPDPQNFLDIQFHSASSGNYTGYRSALVDGLLDQAGTERDAGARMKLYQDAETTIVSDAPWIPLFHGVDYLLVRPYVKGFSITPQGMYNLERAYIENP